MDEYLYEDDPLNHRVKLIKDHRFGECYLHTWDISQELANAYLDNWQGLDLRNYILSNFRAKGIIPLDARF